MIFAMDGIRTYACLHFADYTLGNLEGKIGRTVLSDLNRMKSFLVGLYFVNITVKSKMSIRFRLAFILQNSTPSGFVQMLLNLHWLYTIEEFGGF